MYNEFEKYLQEHDIIRKYIFQDEVYEGRSSSKEIFLMNEMEVDYLIRLAKRVSKKFKKEKYNHTDNNLKNQSIQRYSADGQILQMVFKDSTDLIKNNTEIDFFKVNEAIITNSLYKNSRWAFIDKELSNMVQFLQLTNYSNNILEENQKIMKKKNLKWYMYK